MIKHQIYVRHSGVLTNSRLSIPMIKHCIRSTLDMEGVDAPCEVSVLVTNNHGIQKINKEFRKVDAPTDVLSFPMHVFATPGWSTMARDEENPENDRLLLGDIILSAERIASQALEYRQSIERETSYLVVHAVLHLLGYDHVDEADDKKLMRAREKEILIELGLREK